MIPTERRPDPRIAAALLLASLMTLGWSVRRALTLDPIPELRAASVPTAVVALAGRPEPPEEKLASALDRNPFHPERRRPHERFRLPGEGASAEAPSISAPVPALTLIGTAVLPEGRGFAMCRWGGDTPRLVRIGERIGDVTLREVKQGRAVFVSSTGERLEVRVQRAGS